MGVEIFKPELDAVAAVEFIHGGRTFVAGETFPHKTLGIHPNALRGLTYAGLIRFVGPIFGVPGHATGAYYPPSDGSGPDSQVATFKASPSETIRVEPPRAQHHKHRR